MALVYPNAGIDRLWAGALKASLKRAPLVAFLRARGLPVAARGPARDSDDLTHATMYLLARGLQRHCRALGCDLHEAQRALVGQTACQVAYGLAAFVDERQAWRVAALVSATKQLASRLNLLAAAGIAAAAAREFSKNIQSSNIWAGSIGSLAAAAVGANCDADIEQLAARISAALARQHVFSALESPADCFPERQLSLV
jgi:hypothetical protein